MNERAANDPIREGHWTDGMSDAELLAWVAFGEVIARRHDRRMLGFLDA